MAVRRSLWICATVSGAVLAWMAASPAEAEITANALTSNALTSNALTSNALTSNALTSNALTSNARSENGVKYNGVKQNAVTPLVDEAMRDRFHGPGTVAVGDLRIHAIVLRGGDRLQVR